LDGGLAGDWTLQGGVPVGGRGQGPALGEEVDDLWATWGEGRGEIVG
jgi:hypothetical protein